MIEVVTFILMEKEDMSDLFLNHFTRIYWIDSVLKVYTI
jgi:hypothetical protein